MSLTSTVGIAKTGTTSLRVTVPEGIVAFLELKAGDKLEWKMEFVNEQREIRVRKAQVTNPETVKLASKYAKVKVKK